MSLIDTHCHLDPKYFPEGPAAALERARAVGVRGAVLIGTGRDTRSAEHAIGVARSAGSAVRATAGIHPHDAETLKPVLDDLAVLAEAQEVVAIGETGLDYYYTYAPRDLQREAFVAQIALARKLKKPLVVHTRDAAEETIELLTSEHASDVGGIIHCFSEDIPFAQKALDLGFYLSFSGIVTFKKAEAIVATAAWAPNDRILVETDSPFLSPVPLRGKPCEPAYVVHTASFVAKLRGTPIDDFAQQTTENASRLFGHIFFT
jgi:TatD DNase family protein